MTITNIIDRRKKPYRFRKINAVIEPTRHDNRCKDADQADGADAWMGYDEREHLSLSEAIAWAAAVPDELTLYLYDEDGGIYPNRFVGEILRAEQQPPEKVFDNADDMMSYLNDAPPKS